MSEGKQEARGWPDIPNFLGNPIVFRDKNLGIVLVADYQGAQWIHKIVNGAWMTVRKVNADDPILILEPLNEYTARQANQPRCTACGQPPMCERPFPHHRECVCHICLQGKAQPDSEEMGRVKGEDAWLDELIECTGQRNYLRTVLRAFAANHRRIVEQAMAEKAAQHYPNEIGNMAYCRCGWKGQNWSAHIRSLASAAPPQEGGEPPTGS
jgi:hypothetical protein